MKTEIHFRMAHIHIVATLPDKVNETIGVNRLYMNNGRMESAKKRRQNGAAIHLFAQQERSKVIATDGRLRCRPFVQPPILRARVFC